jgi:hypothetical protein
MAGLDPAIHDLRRLQKDVDARDKPGHDDEKKTKAGSDPGLFSYRPHPRAVRSRQSSGSTLTIDAPSLLPTQKLTGVVELSTKTLRILVERGSR